MGAVYDKSQSCSDLTSVINLTSVHLQRAGIVGWSECRAVSHPRIIFQSPRPPAELRWGSVLHSPWGMSLSRCHISPAVCSGLMGLRDVRPLWSPAGTVSRGWWEKYRPNILFFRFQLSVCLSVYISFFQSFSSFVIPYKPVWYVEVFDRKSSIGCWFFIVIDRKTRIYKRQRF